MKGRHASEGTSMCDPKVLRLIAFIAPAYVVVVWAGILVV
jgi:hypothetical protein